MSHRDIGPAVDVYEGEMQDLADKLREMCDSVPDDSVTTAYQFFGIKYAAHLDGTRIMDLDRLSLQAGLENPCGHEIRKGVNISPHVSLRPDFLPWNAHNKGAGRYNENVKLLAPKFRHVRLQAPKSKLIRTVALFAIENHEPLEGFTFNDLGNLCDMAGVRRMHRNELRQGQKLSHYVQFKSYPSEG